MTERLSRLVRTRKALAFLLAVVLGVVAFFVYPVLGAQGAFAVLIAAASLLGMLVVLSILEIRRGAWLPAAKGSDRREVRSYLTSSFREVTTELDAVEQRLKLAMQQYAEQTLVGVHGNYARLEETLQGGGVDASGRALSPPASLPDAVDEITQVQDRLYGQIEGLERLLALLRGEAPPPATYHTGAPRPDCLSILLSLMEERRPRLIVECGSGVSTLVLAKAARLNGTGHVVSLERKGDRAAGTAALLERYGVEDLVTLHVSELVQHELSGDEYLWYDLEELTLTSSIDLLFVDAPDGTQAQARYPAVPLLRERLADDAVIALDDTRRPEEAQVVERWCREFGWLQSRSVDTQHGTTILTVRR